MRAVKSLQRIEDIQPHSNERSVILVLLLRPLSPREDAFHRIRRINRRKRYLDVLYCRNQFIELKPFTFGHPAIIP